MRWLSEHVEMIRIGRNEEACANCAHFIQHYVKIDGEYRKISRGHCLCGRLKDRSAGEKCRRYEERRI